MVLRNKTKLVLLSIAAITSLLMGNVFQVYAAPDQQKSSHSGSIRTCDQ